MPHLTFAHQDLCCSRCLQLACFGMCVAHLEGMPLKSASCSLVGAEADEEGDKQDS